MKLEARLRAFAAFARHADDDACAEQQIASLVHLAQKYGTELRLPSTADFRSVEQPASNGTGRKLAVRDTIDFRISTSGWVADWPLAGRQRTIAGA